MLRRTPLKRSGFKSKTVKRHSERQNIPELFPARPINRVQPGAWCQQTRVSSAPAAAQPKHEYVRSEVLRKAFRRIPCQHCGQDDGTVCCAHANSSAFGKGAMIKADDNRAASLCAACHVPILDQGSRLSRLERQQMFWTAHVRSVALLVKLGLWPADVPVPDTSVSPWEGVK